ncbi:MAG: uroporphyrinogen decarboxylase family protein [Terriglobia bacterium]
MPSPNISRRTFMTACGASASLLMTKNLLAASTKASLSKIDRVKAVLQAERVDRPPFSFWHHFGLENQPGEKHAEATLAFYRKFDVDILKVMSDYPYPLPPNLTAITDFSDWEKFEPIKNPFPEQIKALKIIDKELKGKAPFVETLFQSWTVLEKLSSKAAVQRLKKEDPTLLKKVLRVISESQGHHARSALDAGAAGIFLAVAAADNSVMDSQEYLKFVRESDLIILDTVKNKGYLNILHVHGNTPHFETLLSYPAHVMNYSVFGTGIGLAEMKKKFSGTLMGGLDEQNLGKLGDASLKGEIQDAIQAMQKRRLIVAPGCSVPNEIADEPLLKVRDFVMES